MEKNLKEEKQIKKLPQKTKSKISTLTPKDRENLEGLLDAIDASGLQEFMEYIRSPWKMLLPNFIAGIARGFGTLVGVTLVLALIGWIFALTIDLPLIGKKLEPYVNRAQDTLNRYIEQADYQDEFREIDQTLKAIEKNTSQNP